MKRFSQHTFARLLLVGSLFTVTACNGQQDADGLARVGEKVVVRIQDMAGGPKGKLAQGLETVTSAWAENSLAVRVASRLRWDKSLAEVDIDVESQGAVITLKGKVKDASQKSRAVDLAQTTQGVDRVEDQLEVK